VGGGFPGKVARCGHRLLELFMSIDPTIISDIATALKCSPDDPGTARLAMALRTLTVPAVPDAPVPYAMVQEYGLHGRDNQPGNLYWHCEICWNAKELAREIKFPSDHNNAFVVTMFGAGANHAPDLVAACQGLLDVIHDNLTHAEQDYNELAICAARAAIIKAGVR